MHNGLFSFFILDQSVLPGLGIYLFLGCSSLPFGDGKSILLMFLIQENEMQMPNANAQAQKDRVCRVRMQEMGESNKFVSFHQKEFLFWKYSIYFLRSLSTVHLARSSHFSSSPLMSLGREKINLNVSRIHMELRATVPN